MIDVTSLFTTEVTEFSARSRLRARMFDTSRSFVERIVSFPTNIEIEASHTYTSPPDIRFAGSGATPPNPFARRRNADGQAHGRHALQHGETS